MDRLISVEEAGRILRLSQACVVRLIELGDLEEVTVSGRRRIEAGALADFVGRPYRIDLRRERSRPAVRSRRDPSLRTG